MQFGTGLGGSVVGGLYGGGSPGTVGSAGAPAASSGPTGAPSLMAAAFGDQAAGGSRTPVVAGWASAAALIGLVFIWWALPR